MTRIIGTLHGDLCTFLIISRRILLRMRNVSDRSCRENQNTHFMYINGGFFAPKYHVVHENAENHSRTGRAADDNIIPRSALHAG